MKPDSLDRLSERLYGRPVSYPVGRRIRLLGFPIAASLLVMLASIVQACSVPVFRYALEHWAPDSYVVTVFYRGSLTDQQQAWLKKLDRNSSQDAKPNTKIVLVAIDELKEGPMLDYWLSHKSDVLPAMVVDMPLSAPSRSIPVWSGPLSESNVDRIIASNVRTELQKRLLASESLVWIFVDGGNAQSDDAAYDLLRREVARLEKTLKLPTIEEEDLTSLSVKPADLKMQFSVLRMKRDDPTEDVLREMLLSIEQDLRDDSLKGQAMAIPVFGRGRALYALTGPGINPSTIEDACRFLTGACQCTVKAENPGVDLLLNANWDQLVKLSEPKDLDLSLVKLPLDNLKPRAEAASAPLEPTAIARESRSDEPKESQALPLVQLPNESPAPAGDGPYNGSAWFAVGAIGVIAFLISIAMFRRA